MSEEEAAGHGGGKKKSPLLIIIVVLVALLLVGGGAAVYFLVVKKPEPTAEHGAAGEGGKADGKGGKSATTLGETVELPPFIVNLVGEGGRYIKIIMVLQVSSAATKEELTNRAPQIKDSVIGVLSSKTPEEVLTPEGKLELKLEMIKRINQSITSGVVTEMFFTEFVVQ
ncbi:MAG: flagellar basal body-associated FliL family protein [Nitrospinae bacterium]|nr:flagellar basal body-associated FliL family protein [Nitrospinota bacterium]